MQGLTEFLGKWKPSFQSHDSFWNFISSVRTTYLLRPVKWGLSSTLLIQYKARINLSWLLNPFYRTVALRQLEVRTSVDVGQRLAQNHTEAMEYGSKKRVYVSYQTNRYESTNSLSTLLRANLKRFSTFLVSKHEHKCFFASGVFEISNNIWSETTAELQTNKLIKQSSSVVHRRVDLIDATNPAISSMIKSKKNAPSFRSLTQSILCQCFKMHCCSPLIGLLHVQEKNDKSEHCS